MADCCCFLCHQQKKRIADKKQQPAVAAHHPSGHSSRRQGGGTTADAIYCRPPLLPPPDEQEDLLLLPPASFKCCLLAHSPTTSFDVHPLCRLYHRCCSAAALLASHGFLPQASPSATFESKKFSCGRHATSGRGAARSSARPPVPRWALLCRVKATRWKHRAPAGWHTCSTPCPARCTCARWRTSCGSPPRTSPG